MSWVVVFAKAALKDVKKVAVAGFKPNVQTLIAILKIDLFQNPTPFEKWVGDLSGAIPTASILSIGWCTKCPSRNVPSLS